MSTSADGARVSAPTRRASRPSRRHSARAPAPPPGSRLTDPPRPPPPQPPNLAGKKLQFVDPEKVQNNVRVNDTIFQFLSIVSGIVTGCLGLTDLKGLAAFLAFNCLIALAVVVKTGFDVKGHFLSFDKILVNGASASAGTFILFWTLFYNICHLF